MKISVEATVAAPIEQVWRAYTTPVDIKQWNAASKDWHTTNATVDLREGGAFSSRMEAKDGTMGFDFAGGINSVSFLRQASEEDVRIAYAAPLLAHQDDIEAQSHDAPDPSHSILC